MRAERIEFLTEDFVNIVGTWRAVAGLAPWGALLLHMMPADRTSWDAFAGCLLEQSISSLAIDMRGHGESTQQEGKTLSYESFSNTEHQASIEDIHAAISWMSDRDCREERSIVIGASFGASLALQYLSAHPAVPLAVLLSPGIDYRGLAILPLVSRLQTNQSLLLVASREDVESVQAVSELDRVLPIPHTVMWLEHAGHGTDMLQKDPLLTDQILTWIIERGGGS